MAGFLAEKHRAKPAFPEQPRQMELMIHRAEQEAGRGEFVSP